MAFSAAFRGYSFFVWQAALPQCGLLQTTGESQRHPHQSLKRITFQMLVVKEQDGKVPMRVLLLTENIDYQVVGQ